MSNNSDSQFIDGQWQPGSGEMFDSCEPGNGERVWSGRTATESEVEQAVVAARQAFPNWQTLSTDQRIEYARKFQEIVQSRQSELALLISREVGKPLWEAKTEAGAVAGKVQLAIDALRERRDESALELSGFQAVTRYKPLGVLGVLGPFNFPAHLPNGHIVPALIAGNTIVFKPSEQAPSVGAWLVQCWQDAGLPKGVVNLVQGARDTGIALVNHPQLDGLLFTGSSQGGVAIHRTFAGQPQKILALEMGGNNPLIVHEVESLKAAAYLTILSSFITAGQRCTCARRLIITDQIADSFLSELTQMLVSVRYGFYSDEPEPFLGTVISPQAGRTLLEGQSQLKASGGKIIVEMQSQRDCDALLSPGIMDVTEVANRPDEEMFGPFLNVIRVSSFDDAILEANNTRYGLSAGLISDRRENFERFIQQIRAGVVNWNRQTTGASGKLPFGGCGLSGNYRPSGYFAADYCSFPVASLESETAVLPESAMMGIDLN